MSEIPGPDVPQNRDLERAALTVALIRGIEGALQGDGVVEFNIPNEELENQGVNVIDYERFIPLRAHDGSLLILSYSYDAIDTSRVDVEEYPQYATGSGLEPYLYIHFFDEADHKYYGIHRLDKSGILSGEFVGWDDFPSGTEVQLISEKSENQDWSSTYNLLERDPAKANEILHRMEGILNGGGALDFRIQDATIQAKAEQGSHLVGPDRVGTASAVRGLSGMRNGIAEMVKEVIPTQQQGQ